MDSDSTSRNDSHTPVEGQRFETLHRFEKLWLRVGVGMLVIFAILAGYDAFRHTQRNSHGARHIQPEKLTQTPPFDKPGTYANSDGSWNAIVVAYAFGFLPKQDLVVPEDVDVHFKIASVDVVHGFQIPGVAATNVMVLPGLVSETTQRFSTPGRYLILCNEYCGSGHHFMTTHIRVLKKGEDPLHPPPLKGVPETQTSVVTPSTHDSTAAHDMDMTAEERAAMNHDMPMNDKKAS